MICVPATDPRNEHIRDMHHIPTWTRDEIGHFFTVYKSLDKPSPASAEHLHDWDDRAAAERVVHESQQRWAAAQAAEADRPVRDGGADPAGAGPAG